MFSDIEELLEFIDTHNTEETRDCEFKRGESWPTLQHKIVKSILAISNIQYGGYIIIGVDWNDVKKVFESTGMSKTDADTYDSDNVLQFTNNFAEPYVRINLKHFDHEGKKFVVIQVQEFDEFPVICKRDFSGILEQGRPYIRTRRKPESSSKFTVAEMKEMMELASDKGLRRLLQRLQRAGLDLSQIAAPTSDADLFRKEREGFE